MKSRTSLKMGHVGSETRSPGEILKKKKPRVRSRGPIFGGILKKLGQNVCHNEISDEFESGAHWV